MSNIIHLLPAWLSAIGTVGAVLVALFLKPILNYINRPKIEIVYNNEPPFYEIREDEANSSSIDKRLVVRVCITNCGKYTAEHAVVNIDEYYSKRTKDDTYVKKSFTPRQFRDCNNAKLSVIAPCLKYYIDIAIIQKFQDIIADGEKGSSKQNYKLYLLGEGKVEKLGRGTFIIPLKFYSSRTDMIIKYMYVYWESDSLTTQKDNFEVKIISKKEFNKISKLP